jgi:plastocyanin
MMERSLTMRLFRWILIPAVALACCACGSSNSPSTPTATGTVVSIVSGSSNLTTTAYSPNPVSVSVGGTVTWMNNDNTAHTSTANGVFDSGNIAPGASFSRTFTTAGSFPYHCSLHPGMVGTVNVQ